MTLPANLQSILPMRLCVFCGSSHGHHPRYADAARALGQQLAGRGIGVVYGGGNVGLMGVLADAALAGGGEVVGVIPHALFAKELGHTAITDLRIVQTMHQRKSLMAELSDGFIALPGGFGTLDELCEILTWAQLGIHHKPCALLNVDGYFDGFLQFLDSAVAEGFLRGEHRALLIVAQEIGDMLQQMSTYRSPIHDQWLTPDQT